MMLRTFLMMDEMLGMIGKMGQIVAIRAQVQMSANKNRDSGSCKSLKINGKVFKGGLELGRSENERK